jgi:hypothetical protein
MTVSELVAISGYSRQRINQLVELGHAHGIQRKPNGRLEVTDRPLAKRWCEFLRKRKAVRTQRNSERKENRDRLKLRREILAVDISGLVRAVYPEVKLGVHAALVKKYDSELLYESNWKPFAEKYSRQAIRSHLQPIDFYRAVFILKGRRPETQMARKALFNFSLDPKLVPWCRSYADIASEYACTRAAVSAAAKQLPRRLPDRSGRLF